MLSNPKTGRKAVEEYLSRLEALQEDASATLKPILGRLGELDEREKRLGDLYDWGRLSAEDFQARLDSVAKARRTLEVERGKRQRDIDEFETRRREIEQIRTAIAEDRFHVVWRPSVERLRVTLFKPEDGRAAPDTKKPVGALRKGIESFEQAVIEARFEGEYDLRRVFDLFKHQARSA